MKKIKYLFFACYLMFVPMAMAGQIGNFGGTISGWPNLPDCSGVVTIGVGCYNTSTKSFCIGNGSSCASIAGGTDGCSLLYGTAAPTTEGKNCDWYIRTTTQYIYGPKAAGTWPAGVTYKGADGTNGTNGAKGDKGDTGSTGAAGAAGATGATGPTGSGYGGTSTTSLEVGTGSKTFTTQAGMAYAVGSRVRATSASTAADWMEGVVTSYSSTTLVLNVDTVGTGADTKADWNLSLAGQPGQGMSASYDGQNGQSMANNTSTYAPQAGYSYGYTFIGGYAYVYLNGTNYKLANYDANNNLTANNHLLGYATTATAAGTTTLTVASANQQFFTGSTTQTVALPVTSTLTTGHRFLLINNSSGVVTVNSSGGNTLQAMAANSQMMVTCISTSGTGTASWAWQYVPWTTTLAIPVSAITASTSQPLGVGSIELGHASDTTVERSAAGVVKVEGLDLPRIVAKGAVTQDNGSISSAACSSAIDGGTATGVATTDRIVWNFNGDPTGVTGFAASASGGLYVIAYPSSDHVSFKFCNNTAGAIDPGSVTINWMVLR